MRGVRFAWRSFPNGLYQKKAKKLTWQSACWAKSAKSLFFCSGPPRGPGGPGIARARRDLSNADCIFQITSVCRSRYGAGAAGRGAGAGGFVRGLGSLRLCVVSRVQAIETTLPTGVWDQQRSRCEARRCEARRCEARRCEVRCLGPLLLCVRRIESTLGTVVLD